jgi:hypothetical protein
MMLIRPVCRVCGRVLVISWQTMKMTCGPCLRRGGVK